MTDVKAPNLAVRGGVDVERLDLAPLLKDPSQKTDLTGHADVDLAWRRRRRQRRRSIA